jgi:transcriptional antiterminator RfaH
MAKLWYALQCKPHKEEQVLRQVASHAIDAFFPQVRVKPANPRARALRPYFPGYMFVRADLSLLGLSLFRHLPHAIGLVSFGGEPASVPDHLLAAIERYLAAVAAAGGEQLFHLRPGDQVVIRHGPFAGYEAIFDARLRDGERVAVLLSILGREQVPIALPAGYIERR